MLCNKQLWSGDPCQDLRRSLSHGPPKIVKKINISTKMAKNIINKDRKIERSAEEAHIVVTGKLFQKDTYIEIVNETVNKIVVDDEIFEINF